MALKRITEEEMNAQGVIAAPDILNGTPAQNKAIFDRMVRSLVAPAVNACVDAIEEANGIAESKGYMEAKVYDRQGKKQDVFQYVEDQINGLTATTSYSKDETLAKETKTVFGLGADAVPDDVLRVLSRFQSGLGNEYVWEKLTVGSGYREVRTNVTGDSIYTVKGAVYTYSDTININQSTGAVSLVNPLTITQGSYDSATVAEAIANKYFTVSAESGLFYCIATSSTQGNQLYITSYDIISSEAYTGTTSYGYVNSPDPNAYPVDDGYTYTALGHLGEKARIATGSYTGTGTYGASNPNSLTFDFAPKLVAFFNPTAYPGCSELIFTDALSESFQSGRGPCFSTSAFYTSFAKKTNEGKTVSWYNTTNLDSAFEQYNGSGTTYYWIAIG